MKTDKMIVGIVTFNNLPMLQRCFASWRAVPNSELVVWDNGSTADTVSWLKAQPIDKLFESPTNVGLCVGRNRIIEYSRDTSTCPYLLLMDSDVLLHEGSAPLMTAALDASPDVGMVSFMQANQGFPVHPDGFVEEVSNECVMSRLRMWAEIGTFPETLLYYSGDSWKSTLANMTGWKTKVISGVQGYEHYAHGSHVNPEVPKILVQDREHWLETEGRFEAYWRRRLLFGKGHTHDGPYLDEAGADWKVPDEVFEPDPALQKLLRPTYTRQYTPDLDVMALIWLAQRVEGNYLEVGCHQGLTLMQVAYNYPERFHYGIDCTGPTAMPSGQAIERPNVYELGWQVRAFRNVRVIDSDFDTFDLSRLENVAFVFLDSDHSYDGVKRCTEKVLAYFAQLPSKRRIIAWHDYIPKKQESATTPSWLKVGSYVRSEMADRFVCRQIRGTAIAYATI